MARTAMALVMIVVLASGCAGMSETQQRVLSGGAIGAAGGAALTAIAGGHIAVGAAVGGAAGAVAGLVADELDKRK